MAQKKKSTRKYTSRATNNKKSVKPAVPQHTLPSGFWSQVGAVVLFVVAGLFITAWFSAGGPVLEWLHNAALSTIGYAVYIVPLICIYVAIETFRAEDNRLPFVMKLATALLVVWAAGLFGLLKDSGGISTGGYIGNLANDGMLALFNGYVAALVYIILIVITALFVIRMSPFAVFSRLKELVTSDDAEANQNVSVMRKAAATDAVHEQEAVRATSTPIADLKLNNGVSTVDPALELPVDLKKGKRLTSMRGSTPPDKVEEKKSALVSVGDPNWKSPSLDLLEKKQSPADAGDVQQNAQIIHDTLGEFNINVEMEGANIGPKVTQYTLRPPSGVKLTRITALETNIALNLAAQSLRIEAPIPGQRAVGIEVPNRKAADVRLFGVLSSKQWKNTSEPLAFAVGKDISGDAVVGELNKMPHLLVAGQTGSGKSVMINTLLTSLLYRNSPSEMKLILVDPKQVEMAPYEDIPHLLTPIIVEPEKTISALKWAVNEMERRYKMLASAKIKDIKTYNTYIQLQNAGATTRGGKAAAKKIEIDDETGEMALDPSGIDEEISNEGAMPYIVIVIDELADLMMMAAKDVEALIVRLAQKARAVGIHLVLATQRPSVDVITGLIKANVPARIAFTVASQVDSRTILDQVGAEKLLGQGDMLMKTADMGKPKRIQGAWVMDEEVMKITDHLRMQSAPQYNDEIISQPVQINGKGGVVMDYAGESDDDMYNDALRVVIESKKASTSYLQRRLRVGYARAARMIEQMEDQGVIGAADGSRPRDVLVSSMDEITSA